MLDVAFRQQEKQKTKDEMRDYLEGLYSLVQNVDEGAKFFQSLNLSSASNTVAHLQSLSGNGFVRAFGMS